MTVISAAVLSAVFCTVASATLTVIAERRTAFFGEDVHIDVPPGDVGEVVFKSSANHSAEVVLMRGGQGLNRRDLNSLGHLVLKDVREKDEGLYVIRDSDHPDIVHELSLTVRDCAVEQVVKYGETFIIHLNHVDGPVTLEFRPSLPQLNQTETQRSTEPPSVVLYNQTAVAVDEYVGRLSVSEKRVTLHSVRMTDEGSFTVLDRDGKVRRRNCLNVREHQTFLRLPYGGNLKMQLYLHHSDVSVVYRPKSDNQDRLVLDRGVLVTPPDPLLEGRLTAVGSELIVDRVVVADAGVFKVTDLAGLTVAHVYVEVQANKLPPLTVAVLAMLGLIASMLLACLLSCLYNVHRRNEKNKKLMLIAQQAGKGADGDAFRQGLEVSKPGRYQALTSENFLEMSDSGVEFTTSGLPLDSDTDGGMTYASNKPLLNAVSPTAVTRGVDPYSPEATVVPDGDLSASRTPDSAMSASPASNPRSLASAAPDGSPRGPASPGAASRVTAGSDSAETDGAESGEAVQQEESAPST
ncbi:hypothetical protein F2P81_023035 [Scophthalmus maximus]|uniref:Uncharacterized protein n=1 Tax=Scophthalmus maximus TaxID=52904 RepID=A0A6A4RQG2_SCOMX|nr:hypothetical protein F2P81_023035 [Scophthalmus maximus]